MRQRLLDALIGLALIGLAGWGFWKLMIADVR